MRALAEQRQLELAHRGLRTHEILPSNSRLKSSSNIRITRVPASASWVCVISFTPALRTLSSSFPDGGRLLLPTWMTDAGAAAPPMVATPQLSLTCLRE